MQKFSPSDVLSQTVLQKVTSPTYVGIAGPLSYKIACVAIALRYSYTLYFHLHIYSDMVIGGRKSGAMGL